MIVTPSTEGAALASKPVAAVTAGPKSDTTWVMATSVDSGRNDRTRSANDAPPSAEVWAAATVATSDPATATVHPRIFMSGVSPSKAVDGDLIYRLLSDIK